MSLQRKTPPIALPPSIHIGTDGAPNVAGLPCETFSNTAGREQLRRYILRRDYTHGSTLIHELLEPDPDDPHDHPWDFTTVLLRGGYREITPAGDLEWWAPVILNRPAEWVHRLEPIGRDHTWTLIATGPARREWGYHTDAGWVPWRTYHGLPPRRF